LDEEDNKSRHIQFMKIATANDVIKFYGWLLRKLFKLLKPSP